MNGNKGLGFKFNLLSFILLFVVLVVSFVEYIIFQHVTYQAKTQIKYLALSLVFIVGFSLALRILRKNDRLEFFFDNSIIKSNLITGFFMGLFFTISFELAPYLFSNNSIFGRGLTITFTELLDLFLIYISSSFLVAILFFELIEELLIELLPKIKYIIPIFIALIYTLLMFFIYSEFNISLIFYFVIGLILSYQKLLFEKQTAISTFTSLFVFNVLLFLFKIIFLV